MKLTHAGPAALFAAAVAVVLGALLPSTALAEGAPAASRAGTEVRARCHTPAQSIVHRKNVSCRRAKKVARRFQNTLIPAPECQGDRSKTWNGWKLTARPTVYGHTEGIGTRFSKGNRSFVLTGGGTC